MQQRLLPLLLLSLASAVACRGGRDVAADRAARAAIDVEHYALNLSLDERARTIEGECAVRFVTIREDVGEVSFHLAGLQVRAVRDDSGRDLSFRTTGDELRIVLAEPSKRGALQVLTIAYGGAPHRGLWFVDDDVTGVVEHVFTQGECEDARGWFPCFDVPFDRATYELAVEVPGHWTTLSGGELVDESTTGDGRRVERWHMAQPVPPYLVTLVAGEFVEREGRHGDVPLSFVAPPEYEPWLEPSLVDTAGALADLEAWTGREYPYAKYAQACVEEFPFGGMENASATTLTVHALGDERHLADSPAKGLVVHEAAHQWFGDLLTCADWSHIWLNEGFATYAGLLFGGDEHATEPFYVRLRNLQRRYLEADRGATRRAIVHDRWREPMDLFFGGHTYEGGATRLHLLRHMLGEEAFVDGVRRYVALNANRAVVTDDLRRAMEEASGKDLGKFFEQWLYSPGHPELEIRWRHDAQREELVIDVAQVQKTGDGTPAAFEFPLGLEILPTASPFPSGDSLTVAYRTLEVSQRRQTFRVNPVRSVPSWIVFDPSISIPMEFTVAGPPEADPRNCLLSQGGGLLRQLEAVGDRLSAETDAGRAERMTRVLGEKLDDPLRTDDVLDFGAYDVLSRRLRAVPTDAAARERLVAGARSEYPPLRRLCLEALQVVGEDAELAALAEEIFVADAPRQVTAAAARLLRHALPRDAARARLRAALDIDSPHGNLRATLLAELAEIDGLDLGELARYLDPAEPERVRVQAARLLGARGKGRPEVTNLLARLFEESSLRLRSAAVEALVELGDPPALAVLAGVDRSRLGPRDRRAIEKTLRERL